MDSFRLWQISQSDLPGFIRQLHDRLQPRRIARPFSFSDRTGRHVQDPLTSLTPISGTSTSAQQPAKRIDLEGKSLPEKMSMLQKIGGLMTLSPYSLNALASNSSFRRMKPGETLFKEGDAILEVAFLLEGQCQLTKRLRHGSGSIQIACLGNGELCTETFVSGLDSSAFRHGHTATITAPSIVLAVDRDHFRSGLKYETIKQLKSHIEIKRMARGQIGNTSGIDQRFLSKSNRPFTIYKQSNYDLTPLTSRLPNLYPTSAFGFLSPIRFTQDSVEKIPYLQEQTLKHTWEPLPMKSLPMRAKVHIKEPIFHQSTPNKLVEKWVSAPGDVEETESAPKEFRLMKSRGIFFHI